jgi:ABC-type spermidine/putrescine transport system permease subunit I
MGIMSAVQVAAHVVNAVCSVVKGVAKTSCTGHTSQLYQRLKTPYASHNVMLRSLRIGLQGTNMSAIMSLWIRKESA